MYIFIAYTTYVLYITYMYTYTTYTTYMYTMERKLCSHTYTHAHIQ